MGWTMARCIGKTQTWECAGRVRIYTVKHWMASTPFILRATTLPGSDFSGRLNRKSSSLTTYGVLSWGVKEIANGRSQLGFIFPLGLSMERAVDQKCQKQSTCTTARFLTFSAACAARPISVSFRKRVLCERCSSRCSPSNSYKTIWALQAPPYRDTYTYSCSPCQDLKRIASLKTPCYCGTNQTRTVAVVFFWKLIVVGEIEKNPFLNVSSPSLLPTMEKSASPPRFLRTISFRMTSPTQQCPQLTVLGQLISHLSLKATIGTRIVPSPAMTTSSSSQSASPGGRNLTAMVTAIPGATSPESSLGYLISAIVNSLVLRGTTLIL